MLAASPLREGKEGEGATLPWRRTMGDRAMQDAQTIHAQTAALVARSRRVAAQARQSLQEHYWLRSHRPVLIRGGAGSDGAAVPLSRPGLRSMVTARLASGVLRPVKSAHSWAGYGNGLPCAVCDVPIGGAEVEYEVENGPGSSTLVHLDCFMAWKRESEAVRKEPPLAGGALLATLLKVEPDSIVLNDESRIFLGPNMRCTHKIGTRLQVVYVQSGGKKIALSIERYWG